MTLAFSCDWKPKKWMSRKPERINLSRCHDRSIDGADPRTKYEVRVGSIDLAATPTALQNLHYVSQRPNLRDWWTLTLKVEIPDIEVMAHSFPYSKPLVAQGFVRFQQVQWARGENRGRCH